MARLADSTVIRHPETHEPTFLEVGSEVPEWASGLIGDHLVAVEEQASEDEVEAEPEPEGGEPDPEAEAPEAPPAKKATPRKRAAKTEK